MLMQPEPWGEALDARPQAPPDRCATTRCCWFRALPAVPFDQALARELGAGALAGLRVRPLRGHRPAGRRGRLGASSASARSRWATTCSTVARSLPWRSSRPSAGCCPESWATQTRSTDESHADGLLEAPAYTKPATWRGRDVPEVLLSGHHAAIARWRRDAVPAVGPRWSALTSSSALDPAALDDR